mmetsp:Transcript_35732/g.47148  ORF Transcript_35732/g.47148 Transcript_35732/m.47148 type:complete len:409 (+) Transcript_35732:90-1316(+)
MEPLFIVDSRHHGKGSVLFAWHPQGNFVASAGTSRVVHVFDSHGKLVDQVVPPSASMCTALEWDHSGEFLAIIQANSSNVVLYSIKEHETSQFDAGVKDITITKWSPCGKKVVLGTSKGVVLIYHRLSGQRVWAQGKHKRKITCGEWSPSGDRLVFASEDRLITVASAAGETIDQFKVKTRPVDAVFGGRNSADEGSVSFNLDSRTILLYDIEEKDGALELDFQSRYGTIVKFLWFGDKGHELMVAFSSGHVVVVSTKGEEYTKEKHCVQMHPTELLDLAYCPDTHRVASCGDSTVKLIEENTWKELKSYYLEKDLETVAFTNRGQMLSVSSKSGCLYTFVIRSRQEDMRSPYPHSVIVRLMKPLTACDLFVILTVIAIMTLTLASSTLVASYEDVIRALFGISSLTI